MRGGWGTCKDSAECTWSKWRYLLNSLLIISKVHRTKCCMKLHLYLLFISFSRCFPISSSPMLFNASIRTPQVGCDGALPDFAIRFTDGLFILACCLVSFAEFNQTDISVLPHMDLAVSFIFTSPISFGAKSSQCSWMISKSFLFP